MTEQEIAALADGLLPTERRTLHEIGDGIHNPNIWVMSLIIDGLIDYRRRLWIFGEHVLHLTKQGTRVRAYLQEQAGEPR